MGIIHENMQWPPLDMHRYKMREHACWYAGDPDILSNFYADDSTQEFLKLPYGTRNKNSFWRRQIKNRTDFYIHVPIASDIAETSAAFLFGETPIIRFTGDGYDNNSQETLDMVLTESKFFQKLVEGAETASALGGTYIKLCWDTDISEYPIPVIVQPDDAFPEFKFGRLYAVEFLAGTYSKDRESHIVYRLFEKYERGRITHTLYQGSDDRLGNIVPISAIEETKDLLEVEKTPDILCAVYIPNMLPNRMERKSSQGRSDLQGIESLMDALDETFSDWMIDLQFARAKIHIPADYLSIDNGDDIKFNIDQGLYVKLEADPTSMTEKITNTQFEIRSDSYEKTTLNLLDRIITSAGYSPQSFGLNIAGRAESGTALNVRERKSFSTTSKKQSYWEAPIKHIVTAIIAICNEILGIKIFGDPASITIEFCDSVSNNLAETANSIKALSDAKAASTETKIRMAHPEWSDAQVANEVKLINDAESQAYSVVNPDENPDIEQLKQGLNDDTDEQIV